MGAGREALAEIDAALVRSGNAGSGARRLIPFLEELVDRFDLLELAVRGLAYEPGPEADAPPVYAPTTTVFGFPVDLVNGSTEQDVRDAVAEMPKGLSSIEVVETLEIAGLVRRKAG